MVAVGGVHVYVSFMFFFVASLGGLRCCVMLDEAKGKNSWKKYRRKGTNWDELSSFRDTLKGVVTMRLIIRLAHF